MIRSKPIFLSALYTICYTIAAITITACGERTYFVSYGSKDRIYKSRKITGVIGEVAPIVFHGRPYLISFNGITNPGDGEIQVQSYPDLSVVSRSPFSYSYGSAIVENDTVHVFASSITTQGPGNHIVTASSTDLIHWSTPVVIFTAPANRTLYNSSVTLTDTGYMLAYEYHEDGHPIWWQNAFLESTDLTAWTQTAGLYAPYGGAACPTIRFYDGYYYLFTLRDRFQNIDGSVYYTTVARSRDMVTWEESGREVLSSAGRSDEGTNNSDIDFFEYSGRTAVIYMVGNQINFAYMKEGIYYGTLAEFLVAWFV